MKKHLFNFVLMLFLVFGVSCATNRPFVQSGLITEKQEVVSFSEVQSILTGNGIIIPIEKTVKTDRKYALVTKEWVENQFADSYWRFLNEFNGLYWTLEAWDCDEFARSAHFLASVLHYKSKQEKTGLCFGEINYITKKWVGHAANIFLYKEGNKIKVGFFEPQNRKIYELTPDEKLITLRVVF